MVGSHSSWEDTSRDHRSKFDSNLIPNRKRSSKQTSGKRRFMNKHLMRKPKMMIVQVFQHKSSSVWLACSKHNAAFFCTFFYSPVLNFSEICCVQIDEAWRKRKGKWGFPYLHWWLRFESDGVGESRGGLYAQVDRAFARVVRSFDGGTASGCVGLPTEIVGHPLPLYRHRHGVFSSSSLALLLLARIFSCASPLFLLQTIGVKWLSCCEGACVRGRGRPQWAINPDSRSSSLIRKT